MNTTVKFPPSVLAEKPAQRVSDKYVFVPTTRIIDDLAEFGWQPSSAKEANTRSIEKVGYQKHIVRFRHPEWNINQVGDSVPEIVLTNSHDGFTSFNLMAGIFRLVCTNGLVVSDATFGKIQIRHLGYDINHVQKASIKFAKMMPKLIQIVDAYKNIKLDDLSALKMAEEALELRWPTEAPIAASSLLQARRRQDTDTTLWSVFNRIQENLFKGGLRGLSKVNSEGRRRRYTTRAIKNINAEIELNRELWALADKYKKAA